MNKFLISASILSADFARLGKDINKVIFSGADLIHLDIMDNHYVPNLTFGPIILRSIRNYGIKIPIDVHLMIKPITKNFIIELIEAGANYISFHPESTKNTYKLLDLIKHYECKAGIALSPSTSLNCINNIIDKLDLILLMSVKPGFSNQSFIKNSFNKIKKINDIINKSKKNIILSVDGGIKIKNIANIAKAGAKLFVIGSAIFNQSNYKIVINAMRYELTNIS